MKPKCFTFQNILALFSLLGAVGFLACSSSNRFGYGEETGPPSAPLDSSVPNPFDPLPPPPPPNGPTEYTDLFQQAASSAKVDIVWMIDSSGSMRDDQQELSANAEAFTDRLENANVDFKLMVITSDSRSDGMLTPRCGTTAGSVITNANASAFAACAIVGDTGSGLEEGLEAVRRALDPQYPKGPWNTAATPKPLNSGFLRSDAALQVIYVSDEEDEPDDKPPTSNSWRGKLGVTDADIVALRYEMAPILDDEGRPFDNRYAFFPFAANHASFLKGLKPSGGPKVRAHAIVTRRIDKNDPDSCYHSDITEEIGQRYSAVASLTGGSVTDFCGAWNTTMDQIGLVVSGLEKCFTLSHIPTDRASIAAQIDGSTVTSFSFVAAGNQVCFDSVPPAGTSILITYK